MKFVIVLILILSFTMLFAAEFEITSKIKENPAHLGLQMLDDQVKYDNNGELCALLIVRCGVKDINFSNTASKVSQIDKQGEYYITMKKGARYIVLKKDGFGSFKEQFGLVMKSGSVYEMSADEKFKQASQIPVVITCNQNGAEVFVDGKSEGKTQNKMLTININIGTHKIKIKKDGFSTEEIEKNISIQNNSFNFKLIPSMPAAVTINTTPKGATVYIDDLKFGTTPKSSFFESGTYPIRIEKENYETINEQITITEPETNKNYNLTDIRASLTIKTHKNATVKFNGKSYKGGIDKLKILPQIISFKIEQDYCETIKQTYTLNKGEKKVFELYPEDISATLTIKTHQNATVKFNGKDYKGGISNQKIAPQVLEITVSMPKAETIIRVITLKAKGTETLEIYPEVQTGTIQVMVIPTNAKIELNGDGGEHYTATGRKTFTDAPVGNYELIVSADGYVIHKEDINLTADNTISNQISLEKEKKIKQNNKISNTKLIKRETNTSNRKRHIIKEGDTLLKISQMYNISISQILNCNGMKKEPKHLWYGAILWLEPDYTDLNEESHNETKKFHIIKEDDTIDKISLKYSIPVSTLIKLNNLKNKNSTLWTGAKLRIR